MTHFPFPRIEGAARATSRHLHWFALGIGLAFSGLCAFLVIGVPSGRGPTVFLGSSESLIASTLDADSLTSGRRLRGISGETFGRGTREIASEDVVISGKNPDLARVMLDDSSDKRCLTVTTANGKTLSFRVLGVHPEQGAAGRNAGKVQLAVAACNNNGETVAKAVIEPDAGQAPKAALPEHSL